MAGQLSGFLTEIAKDPQKMKAFRTDPHGAMTQAGLSHEEMNAVFSKNPSTIGKLVGTGARVGGIAGAADADTTVVVVVL